MPTLAASPTGESSYNLADCVHGKYFGRSKRAGTNALPECFSYNQGILPPFQSATDGTFSLILRNPAYDRPFFPGLRLLVDGVDV